MPPQDSISPTPLNFGNQLLNVTRASQVVTVTNKGGSNLIINSISSAPSQVHLLITSPSRRFLRNSIRGALTFFLHDNVTSGLVRYS